MTAAFKKRPIDPSRILREARQSLADATADSTGFEVGKVYDVPVGRIRPNPSNARAIYPDGAGRKLQDSFLETGQTLAALGFLDLAGDVVLIDGRRRLNACKALGWATLRVEIRPVPENEQALYLASRNANVEREDQTPLDDALVWTSLLKRKVFKNQAALGKALKIDDATVSRTLKLEKLPSSLIQALADHPKLLNLKMLNALRELFVLQGEEKTLVFIIEAASEGLSYREVEARRKKLAQGTMPRIRATIRKDVTYHGAKGCLKTYEKGGRLELSLKGLSPAKLAEVAKLLDAALSG